MPRSPDRYPRYPARRYTPDRSYDRRDSRDEYRRPRDDDRRPAPPGGSSYRGRGYSPSRGRDRSWERERDRERERDYPRDRDRYDDRERKRTRSPSPIRRRYSPPPLGDRFRPRYASYDRAPSPRGAGLVYPPAETPLRDVAPEKREEADESEEEGMVTPPQAKRKAEVKPVAEKPRLVVVSEPRRRVVDSPPHQSKSRIPPISSAPPVEPAPATAPASAPAKEPVTRARSRSPVRISLPSLSGKPKPTNTPSMPAFGEIHARPPPTSAPMDRKSNDPIPPRSAPPRRNWPDRHPEPEPRGRRYSTSSSWASRSRSPRARSRSPRSISPSRPRATTGTTAHPQTRYRSRSRGPRRTRSRSMDSRSRSRSRTRSTRSPSRTRSPVHAPPRAPSSFMRPILGGRAPPTGPAADPVSVPAVRNFIPTGPRGRGRGTMVAPRAPRAERLGYVQPFRGVVRPVMVQREEVQKEVVKEPVKVEMQKEEMVHVVPVAPVVPTEAPPEEPRATLLPDREEKFKIQFKRDEPPALPDRSSHAPPVTAKLLASSPVAPLSSPATPFEKPTASPGKIGSSPVDYGSTPAPEEPQKNEQTPVRKPSYIAIPPAQRSRASSSAIPPTPGVRTPHPQPTNLRHSTSYVRPAPMWKEYPPPPEPRWRDRPTGADVVLELKTMGVVLADEGYRGLADRDTTRIAGDWERQLVKMQYERALLTHSFQVVASSLRVKKYELGNALDEVWVAERKVEAAGMSMETAGFSPKRE